MAVRDAEPEAASLSEALWLVAGWSGRTAGRMPSMVMVWPNGLLRMAGWGVRDLVVERPGDSLSAAAVHPSVFSDRGPVLTGSQ